VPTARAACTQAWSGGTVRSVAIASEIGTVTISDRLYDWPEASRP
jgi:hypothetical protein